MKGFKVLLKLGERYDFITEELEGITEIHFNYDSVLEGKSIAFEGEKTGITYYIKDVKEFEAVLRVGVEKERN
uniref:Uncharacterized protein n=1 Tax=viral metagenome TaxID=1070528 RepID=A0A6H2A2K6_9ZZZZ